MAAKKQGDSGGDTRPGFVSSGTGDVVSATTDVHTDTSLTDGSLTDTSVTDRSVTASSTATEEEESEYPDTSSDYDPDGPSSHPGRGIVQFLVFVNLLWSVAEFLFMLFAVYAIHLVDSGKLISVILVCMQVAGLLFFLGVYGLALYQISIHDNYLRVFFFQQAVFPSGHIVVFIIFFAKFVMTQTQYYDGGESARAKLEKDPLSLNAADYPLTAAASVTGFVAYAVFFLYSLCAHTMISNEVDWRKERSSALAREVEEMEARVRLTLYDDDYDK